MKKLFLTLLILFVFIETGFAHSSLGIRSAMRHLERGDLQKAEQELYRSWFAEPDDFAINYNLGIVNYRKRDYQKARRFFSAAAATDAKPELKFNSLYNLGNAAFKQGDYPAAVDAYKSSLDLKKDPLAEYNLQVAMQKLEMQQQQQEDQQQQNQENSKDQQKQGNDDQQQSQKQDRDSEQQNQGDSGKKDQGSENSSKEDGGKSDHASDGQNEKSETDQNEQQAGKPEDAGDAGDGDEKSEGSDSQSDKENENQQQELAGGGKDGDEQNRQEMEVPQNERGETKNIPEASQRARALKNMKLNPYMVEKILRDKEAREREAQLRARNESVRRDEDADPFSMNAHELRDWMENRRRPRQQKNDERDW